MAGFTLDCRRKIIWRSACGIAWHHRWSENVVVVPLMTPMKWSFHACMDFSAMLRQWLSGSASWKVIPVAKISYLWAFDISLSKTWCLGTMMHLCICRSIIRRDSIKSPSVLLLVVLIIVQFLSILLATT